MMHVGVIRIVLCRECIEKLKTEGVSRLRGILRAVAYRLLAEGWTKPGNWRRAIAGQLLAARRSIHSYGVSINVVEVEHAAEPDSAEPILRPSRKSAERLVAVLEFHASNGDRLRLMLGKREIRRWIGAIPAADAAIERRLLRHGHRDHGHRGRELHHVEVLRPSWPTCEDETRLHLGIKLAVRS
jgi:hypothetical protein